MKPSTPPFNLAAPRVVNAILQRSRSRQEVAATGWACLIPAGLCLPFQPWLGLGFIAAGAAYCFTFRWADRHAAWQVPPRQRSLAADIVRALHHGWLGLATTASLLFLLAAGALALRQAASTGESVSATAAVILALLALGAQGVTSFPDVRRWRSGSRNRMSPAL